VQKPDPIAVSFQIRLIQIELRKEKKRSDPLVRRTPDTLRGGAPAGLAAIGRPRFSAEGVWPLAPARPERACPSAHSPRSCLALPLLPGAPARLTWAGPSARGRVARSRPPGSDRPGSLDPRQAPPSSASAWDRPRPAPRRLSALGRTCISRSWLVFSVLCCGTQLELIVSFNS
jgi:hypothetical protein